MKTRYLVLFLSAAGASFGIGACSGGNTLDPDQLARLRNELPNVCTADRIAACPALEVTRCPGGQEPVIDYSSDCCAHFTCQPLCQSAQQQTCSRTPAPVCPGGTKLWIGTALEDCCPAYRCEPDGTMCDPNTQRCACDATNVACTLALPYCGPDVKPIVVGQTADCCPVYQCPCNTPMTTIDPATGMTRAAEPGFCGCTYPNCQAGEEVVCEGTDACMGPCYCKPARGICKDDSSCASDERCDRSSCRLPPAPADAMAPTCDTQKCGPQPGLSRRVCADGSIAGPTGRCLLNADGSCGWEIVDCASDGCYGVCVPNIQAGCRASTDCPSGQVCEVQCSGWGCSSGGTTTDPATGTMTPPDATCTCPASDPSCVCDAAGNCKGQQCVGRCVPEKPTCDPTKPVACPTFAPVCPNGQMPIPTGIDPNTCCETYTCPVCDLRATTAPPSTCPAVRCACAKVVATDPVSCCPKYECGAVNADGSCA